MAELIPQIAALEGCDAPHRARNKDTHRTHWPAAEYLSAARVRSDGTLGIVSKTAGFPVLSQSAHRKLVEVAQ
ncbi:MAG: hypothetical protein E2586_22975 [Novosphingobium sp.]|uniref:hypothetical protein n=1 Tax=Novosphingobium sp. TaxID=1874826 RepID=UPI0012CDBD4B|nr:hypothetical protein [Novosphingobium sp.]MPS71345.1 hypothetical protein [Novosphingobium sp.]